MLACTTRAITTEQAAERLGITPKRLVSIASSMGIKPVAEVRVLYLATEDVATIEQHMVKRSDRPKTGGGGGV